MLNVRIITIMPKKLTTEEWINKARIKHGDKYDYSKVKYNGTSCSSSKGEEEVCNILLSNGIKFIREYTIQVPNEINTSGHAYIDFYLPEYNTFVEYNGIQHYNPKMAFGGSFKFERQQARDEYVRQYCKDNNIKLIEIRYDEDVWEVLTRELLDNQTTNEECK